LVKNFGTKEGGSMISTTQGKVLKQVDTGQKKVEQPTFEGDDSLGRRYSWCLSVWLWRALQQPGLVSC